MPTTSPKTFDYHNFLREALRQSDPREYFLADQNDLSSHLLGVPYRNYFYGIGLAKLGNRRLRVGFDTVEFKAGTLMAIGPGTLRQWLDLSMPFEAETIFFSSELFQPPINPHFLTETNLFRPGGNPVLALSENEIGAVGQVFEGIKKFRGEPKIVAAQTLLLLEMAELFRQSGERKMAAAAPASRHENLLREFDGLLQKHFLENKDVAFYAQKLNLSANHFSETIKNITGKPAKKRIEEALVFEAKSLLRQTSMSIKEVTYWLGFEDDSYFVKFFKQAEGITPNAFRVQNP